MLLMFAMLSALPYGARAQLSTPTYEIWSATLTVGETTDTVTKGYHAALGIGSLSKTSFTYAGSQYTVTRLIVNDLSGTYELGLSFDKAWPHADIAVIDVGAAIDAPLPAFTTSGFGTQTIASVPTTWAKDDTLTVRILAGPEIRSIALTSTPSGRSHYAVGDTVTASVRFSHGIAISGTPQLTLDIGGTDRTANCTTTNVRTTLACSYTITESDSATDGIGIEANSLALNGGTIEQTGSMGLGVALTHRAVTRSLNHRVDHPGPVQNLKAYGTNGRVALTWDRPSYLGAGGRNAGAFVFYHEYQQKVGTANWGPWQRASDGTTHGLVISGLTNGTVHRFRVRAVTWNAFGRQSDDVRTTPAPRFRLGVSSNGFREGSNRGVTATVSITDGYVLDAPQTFDLEWLGAAVAGTHYMHDDNPTSITLPAGSIHASVVLRAKHTGSPDYVVPVESELVAKYHGNVIGRQPLTLYDNDPEPVMTLSTSATEVNEGNAFTLTATLSAKTNEPVFVFLNVGNPNKRPLTGIPKDLSTYPNCCSSLCSVADFSVYF